MSAAGSRCTSRVIMPGGHPSTVPGSGSVNCTQQANPDRKGRDSTESALLRWLPSPRFEEVSAAGGRLELRRLRFVRGAVAHLQLIARDFVNPVALLPLQRPFGELERDGFGTGGFVHGDVCNRQPQDDGLV